MLQCCSLHLSACSPQAPQVWNLVLLTHHAAWPRGALPFQHFPPPCPMRLHPGDHFLWRPGMGAVPSPCPPVALCFSSLLTCYRWCLSVHQRELWIPWEQETMSWCICFLKPDTEPDPVVDTVLSSLLCVKAALRGWWHCLFRWWVPITESVPGRSSEGAITQKFLFCLAFSYIHVVSFFLNLNFHLLFIFGS